MEKIFKSYHSVYVLKIGANDGVLSDPLANILLNDSRYMGLLVEPMPQYAKLLRDNYDHTGRFTIEEVAIGPSNQQISMYYVADDATDENDEPFPGWVHSIASTDRAHVEKHLSRENWIHIREALVECNTVENLLEKNEVEKVDLLHIDAMGYDFVILRQFDFQRIRPALVLFEHKHLNESDRDAAQKLMQAAGYHVQVMESDMFCRLE